MTTLSFSAIFFDQVHEAYSAGPFLMNKTAPPPQGEIEEDPWSLERHRRKVHENTLLKRKKAMNRMTKMKRRTKKYL